MQLEEYRALQQETTVEGLKVSYLAQGEGTPRLLIHGIPEWGVSVERLRLDGSGE